MLKPRQMNEDGLDVREANHRMMNMLAILLALFHRNFSKFSDQCVRGAVTKFENQIMAASELLRTISSTPTAEDAAVDVYLERLAVCGKTGKFELLPFRYGALCCWFSRLARHKRLFLVSLRSSPMRQPISGCGSGCRR